MAKRVEQAALFPSGAPVAGAPALSLSWVVRVYRPDDRQTRPWRVGRRSFQAEYRARSDVVEDAAGLTGRPMKTIRGECLLLLAVHGANHLWTCIGQ